MHASRALLARLVNNHSLMAPGLRPVLKRLAEALPDSDTITPGRVSETRGRRERFTLSMSTASNELHVNRWKLLARNGKMVQEVFVTSQLPREELEAQVQLIVNKCHG